MNWLYCKWDAFSLNPFFFFIDSSSRVSFAQMWEKEYFSKRSQSLIWDCNVRLEHENRVHVLYSEVGKPNIEAFHLICLAGTPRRIIVKTWTYSSRKPKLCEWDIVITDYWKWRWGLFYLLQVSNLQKQFWLKPPKEQNANEIRPCCLQK